MEPTSHTEDLRFEYWDSFMARFDHVQREVHGNSVMKGFWDNRQTEPHLILLEKSQKLALIHQEISECLDAIRTENKMSSKVPEITEEAEELADAVIRIMDYAEAYNVELSDAILSKATYNKSRPHKHGKKF